MGTRQAVLIDLDTLSDTRIGALTVRHPELMTNQAITQYSKRVYADIGEHFGISEAQWKDIWNSRDKHTLMASPPTPFAYNMRQFMVNRFVIGKTTGIVDPLEIYINIWPMKLSNAECTVMVDELKREVFWLETKVELVSIPLDQLTPSRIRLGYDSVIMYNFHEWFNIHNEALAKSPMPKVTMYVPAYLTFKNEELDKILDENESNPYNDLRQFLSPFVTVTGLDRSLFSCSVLAFPLEVSTPKSADLVQVDLITHGGDLTLGDLEVRK